MNEQERLPWRVEPRLARLLDPARHLELRLQQGSALPTIRCVFARPSAAKVSLHLRVHSHAGIPLATATVVVNPGDHAFETPISLLAMEGYGHLSRPAREKVERRVWSRRAFASAWLAEAPRAEAAHAEAPKARRRTA